jgi:hypothetical protein
MSTRDDYLAIIDFAKNNLEGRESEVDRILHGYFRTLHDQAEGAQFAVAPRQPVVVLHAVISQIDESRKKPNVLRKGVFGFTSYFLIWAAELRKIICGGRKTPSKLGPQWHAVIAAIAMYITQQLDVPSPTAVGIATLVLLTLMQTTKNAFCKMTDNEVYKAIRAALEGK